MWLDFIWSTEANVEQKQCVHPLNQGEDWSKQSKFLVTKKGKNKEDLTTEAKMYVKIKDQIY